jgi:hypothetical protein
MGIGLLGQEKLELAGNEKVSWPNALAKLMESSSEDFRILKKGYICLCAIKYVA